MKKVPSEQENFRQFIDRITDGFIALDKDFCYTYVNTKVGELVQRHPASLLGKNVWEEFPDAVGSNTFKAFQTAMNEQRFISNIDYYAPLDLWQENYIYPSPEGLSVFIKDISDRKRLEKKLREQERNQQFEIMITALEAQEKERTYIGRELHDNVNQLLVATKLMLTISKDQPDQAGQILANCINNLDKAIEENRRISHELITPQLKEEGLIQQLRFLTHSMLAANGIDAVVEDEEFNENLLDETQKLTVYRIAQEQCTNIVKYAKAREVIIRLKANENDFTMVIMDDGQGMKGENRNRGIGLKNIEGRVAVFGGSVEIETAPGKGFSLEICMPIQTGPDVQYDKSSIYS